MKLFISAPSSFHLKGVKLSLSKCPGDRIRRRQEPLFRLIGWCNNSAIVIAHLAYQNF
jgi:hypothetical protein